MDKIVNLPVVVLSFSSQGNHFLIVPTPKLLFILTGRFWKLYPLFLLMNFTIISDLFINSAFRNQRYTLEQNRILKEVLHKKKLHNIWQIAVLNNCYTVNKYQICIYIF